MKKPKAWKRGDRVAVVSLSSGMLGENFCAHELELGTKRLREFGLEPVFMPYARKGIEFLAAHPEARAEDLKQAFADDSIAGIVCAIGGDDTYRLLPYLMEDEAFIRSVQEKPKLFTGFSDTTVNHLMFYRLGLGTFYGPCLICDLAELAERMLPYTEAAFRGYLEGSGTWEIRPSDVWYEEREDFSADALGTERRAHRERRGFELLQGAGVFEGELLGGCLESMYDMLTSSRYGNEKEVCSAYGIFPGADVWKGKILFAETSEEKPEPALLRKELRALREQGVFDAVNGILVGKPQDETYYEAYQEIWRQEVGNRELPILYNLNFGHAAPRCALPYGVRVRADAGAQTVSLLESPFA